MSPSPRHRAGPVRVGVAACLVTMALLTAVGGGTASGRAFVPQYGFNSYAPDECQSASVWAADAKGQFTALKGLGANSIALAFPIYQSSLRSNTVFAKRTCAPNIYETPSTSRLAVPITTAHNMHLRVMLRPLLDETVLKQQGGWRGGIRPTNVRLWFRSYQTVLTPYLHMAQNMHVEYFAISTELDSLATRSNWTALINFAHRIYRGQLIFTINWTQTSVGKVTKPGTAPGMDAYQIAALPNSATPAQLLTSWNNALTSVDTVPFPLSSASIDEVAILAQDGAYSEPWAWSLPASTHPFDPSIQANWYSMVCSFVKTHNMRGVYFWGVFYQNGANAVLTTPNSNYTQEIQPASAAVIKSCYTGT